MVKLERDFVLEMCALKEGDEVGLARLTRLVEQSGQLFRLYGLLGDELGDFAREMDTLTADVCGVLGVDDAALYPFLLDRNAAVLRHLDRLRAEAAPGAWADDVVAAAGGSAKVYNDALNVVVCA